MDERQLIESYNAADLFFFIYLYEGFGFPLLEAMRCGTKVVCSDNSSLKELGGEYAIFINPRKTFSIIRPFFAAKVNCEGDALLVKYAMSFSWDKTALSHSEIFSVF